jgi:thiamine-phosphate pyrophosphorylase
MRARQTRPEPRRKALPLLWLLSDERNDAVLEQALARLPRGSGFVFRHYHLNETERRMRFLQLAAIARGFDHCLILSGNRWEDAVTWGSDGLYAAPSAISGVRPSGLLWLATAHGARDIAAANRRGADGLFLSPVYPTRSHPGAKTLGAEGFRRLASGSKTPVIALGGMDAGRASELGWPRWAAIDGLS